MRLLRFPLALAALAPVALVASMVSHLPPAATHVPKVQLAAAGGPFALTPEKLGATRDEGGLRVERAELEKTLKELAARFEVAPQPGGYEMTPDGVVLNLGVPGAKLDVSAARGILLEALRSSGATKSLTLPVVEVAPPAPPPFGIIVRLSDLKLDLYEGTSLRKTYSVGIGALRFPTPPGVYHIKSKAKNPSWNNPGSPWARGMPRSIPPGPKNPLGTRALRLDRGALVIHGTPDQSSVGRRSSHGCMRMYRADVEELFEIVPVGTPVFIIP